MLVLAGLISVGAVVAVGLAFALVVAVVVLAYFVVRQRSSLVQPVAARALGFGGAAMAAIGLWLSGSSVNRPLVSVSIAMLAGSALLTVARLNVDRRQA